ncbi:sensor histidine kinase [Pleionea mediterranea]|uniref:Two-component system sensor histidine kinase DesK n=1 Tax=Pleionea mediterranea TaxID=523701 RepID=A0A316FZR9_9GAMM|nr:sensor histidine kinase [Pleionea mediterranea]PWK53635.1 two-component system sensor histidine kinase DesK [Pleionea mediterranea]
MNNPLIKLHHFLLPQEKSLGYMPYLWLCYLLIFFFNFIFMPPSKEVVIATSIAIPVFLLVYFSAFHRSQAGLFLHIFLIYLIGAVMAHYHFGASVFFVYAASFCAGLDSIRKGVITIAILILLIAVQAYIFDFKPYFYFPAIFFSLIIGLSNIYMSEIGRKNKVIKQSQQDIKHMAAQAERERIARDLHDIIGHTFSLISKKSELAAKLIDRSPQQAKKEIADIERESREALTQVREAVSGYRKTDFVSELASAKALCRAADITFDHQVDQQAINNLNNNQLNQSLGFIVREAMTNIVKHSNADHCNVTLKQDSKVLYLSIVDNGHCPIIKSGNGLNGIKERVKNLSGKLTINTNKGVSLLMEFPLT